MNLHWAADFFEQGIISKESLLGESQHSLELLQLDDGSAWVAKRFKAWNWLGRLDRSQLEFSQALAEVVALHLKQAPLPFSWKKQRVFSLEQDLCILYPFVEGQSFLRLSSQAAQALGQGLACMHTFDFPPSLRERGRPFFFPVNKALFLPFPFNHRLCEAAALLGHREKEWVLGHRDLHLQNIIWQTKSAYVWIDWENAGLIHPFLELLGLALNVAGIAELSFRASAFKEVLLGYKLRAQNLPWPDEQLWSLSSLTWLLWWAYCEEGGLEKESLQAQAMLRNLDKHAKDIQSLYMALC